MPRGWGREATIERGWVGASFSERGICLEKVVENFDHLFFVWIFFAHTFDGVLDFSYQEIYF